MWEWSCPNLLVLETQGTTPLSLPKPRTVAVPSDAFRLLDTEGATGALRSKLCALPLRLRAPGTSHPKPLQTFCPTRPWEEVWS